MTRAVHYTVYLVLLGMVYSMRLLPRRFALWIGNGFGLAAYHLLKRRRRFALENLKTVFPNGLPSPGSNHSGTGSRNPDLEEVLKHAYGHFGKMAIEFMRITDLQRDSLDRFVAYEGLEHLDAAFRKGKGVILATAHFGNFEWMNGGIALKGYPMNSVIRFVDNPYLDGLIDSIRGSTGLRIIKRKVAAFAVLERLRRGDVISLAIDQNSARGGLFMPFFGKTAATMIGPAQLHAWSGSPVLFAFSVRMRDDTHRVTILPEFPFVKTDDPDVDLYINMTMLNEVLEKAILENPEMWFWLHRRWKRRPKPAEEEKRKNLVLRVERAAGERNDLARWFPQGGSSADVGTGSETGPNG